MTMDKKKITVGILFGGKSAEHEVSLQSAKNVFEAIDKDKYEPVLISIDKTGRWVLCDSADYLEHADNPQQIKLKPATDYIALVSQCSGQISHLSENIDSPKIDVVFPILHGPYGEDGTVQGLLKLANVPFVGASVLGSAIGMDKDILKRLLRDAGLPIGKFVAVKSDGLIPEFKAIKTAIGLPYFIKPANMGSSIGVSKVSAESEYLPALKNAFQYDTKIIIEEFINGREIECAVLGNSEPIATVPGEVISSHDFYSYEAKYIDENGAQLTIPAEIPNEIAAKIQDLAIKTFATLSCEGLGRIDFFLQTDGRIIINEINTMPGFTKISMYPKLWEKSGISYTDLIDKLIQLAIERFDKEQQLKTSYIS